MSNNTSLGIKKRLKLELFKQIVDTRIELHPLRSLFWECTLRCNLACRHCGSDCRSHSTIQDMPKEDFYKVIDRIKGEVNPNKTLIIMIGGEVLMRKDIEEVGLYLYHNGFPWGIVTNGMALRKQRLDSLIRSGLSSLTVSLDGFAEEHNHIRGHKEAFDNAVYAIKAIVEEPDLVWDIVTCITPRSLATIKEFKEFIYSIGVRRWRIFTIVPMGRAKADDSLQLTSQEFKQLMDFIIETRKEGLIKLDYACEGFLGRYEREVRDTLYQCHAGVNVASILADGSISGCLSIRSKFYQGNIYKDDFWEVWQNRFEDYRNRDWMRKGECASCRMFRYCRGGGMHLRDENGELMLCHLQKLKY